VLALRGDRVRGAVLVVFPLVLYLFLGGQARYFGRWLLPAYPMIAVLAAFGAVRAADALARRRAGWGRFAVAGFAALLVVQGLAASVRVDAVLGQRDTRSLARTWLLATVPAGTRIVLEPFTPGNYLTLGAAGRRRWVRYPVRRPFQAYEKRLAPALVDAYRAQGYCTVIVASTQKQRGLRAGLRGAQSYYERLAAESARTVVFSPYRADRRPVPFNFDLSFDYLPRAYARPGPLIEVHRLRACPLPRAAVASASGRGA